MYIICSPYVLRIDGIDGIDGPNCDYYGFIDTAL